MDYKQKYKDALERAKDVYTYYCDDREQLRKIESIFPELAESEDERMRKHLIEDLKWRLNGALDQDANGWDKRKDIEAYKWGIAWLEKQVPKSKWTEEDERNLNMAIYFMRSENTPYSPTDVEPVVEWLCGLKQRMEE